MEIKLEIAIGPVFDEFGGVSQHILGIEKYSSHRIHVLPSKLTRKILRNNLSRSLYTKFFNEISLNGYDIVHSHVNPWMINLCQASRKKNCKWVHTYHTLYFKEDYPDGLQKWQEDINNSLISVACKADVRISISKWLHDYLIKTYSIETEIIPNGVDIDGCNNADPHRFKKKYSLGDFILFVGSIQYIKNPQLFIELAIQIPEVNFVMIGKGIDAIHLKKEYGVSIPKNLIVMGEMNHSDTIDAIAACKVFVMTSKREGIPTVLLEAMGLGKPVVVPDHSGCKELVPSREFGFYYEPDSIDDLIEQTNKALTSRYAGEKARERVIENYDWKILAKKIDYLYESC